MTLSANAPSYCLRERPLPVSAKLYMRTPQMTPRLSGTRPHIQIPPPPSHQAPSRSPSAKTVSRKATPYPQANLLCQLDSEPPHSWHLRKMHRTSRARRLRRRRSRGFRHRSQAETKGRQRRERDRQRSSLCAAKIDRQTYPLSATSTKKATNATEKTIPPPSAKPRKQDAPNPNRQ